MTKEEILKQLDDCAREYRFPMLNNIYSPNADIRLTSFHSPSEWLIVFEEITVYKKMSFSNIISAYGNGFDNPILKMIKVIQGLPDNPIWDDDGNFLLDRFNFCISIKGKKKSFNPLPGDYQHAGVDIDSDIDPPLQILRLLTNIEPELFFLSDKEILTSIGRQSKGFTRFIQLNEWFHPDIAMDELPSENECFQKLASAIAENNIKLYTCPKNKFNTHWSNWDYL